MNHYEIDSCGFGLLVNLNNQKSSKLIQEALSGLARLSHRGAVGEDGLSGDGCGIMIQLDQPFFSQLAEAASITIKRPFAVGMCFLNSKNAKSNRKQLEHSLKKLGFHVAGWRDVPLEVQYIAEKQRQAMPLISQIFVEFPRNWTIDEVEKKLFLAKLLAHKALEEDKHFTICSLSTKTIVYKALVLTKNLPLFYPDLQSKGLTSAVAIVHQRFSTNTLSSWRLAQPFSTLAHNGEINTIQGNRHFAKRFSHQLINTHFPELQGLDTVINKYGSDSLSMDNFLESLSHGGLSCPEALRLMIPPAWENNTQISPEAKDYYRYHALHLPPWEGPAGLAFFDGRFVGCILDRNGFRPARIVKNKDNWMGIGSEIGIFDFENQEITQLSRMKPGELLVFDLEANERVEANYYIDQFPYVDWINKNATTLTDKESEEILNHYSPISGALCKRFDVSFEEKEQVLRYMGEYGVEPTSSMGDDTPMAALSLKPRQLFDFFRQQFAQVTNPPIDSLREKSVISAQTYLGNRALITQKTAALAQQIELPSPLITRAQLDALITLPKIHYSVTHASLAYSNSSTLKESLDVFVNNFSSLITKTHQIIIVADDQFNEDECLIHPSLAIGALHHELIKRNQREQVSLIVNTAWVRDPHQLAILIACGADAVYPWLGYNLSIELAIENQNDPIESLTNYRQSLNKGLLKICSKMGVCTINSYRGAQLFHVIGLNREIVQRCFSQSAYLLEKHSWESLDACQKGFYEESIDETIEPRRGGLYKYTYEGEYHDYNPDVVTSLLRAVTEGDARYYQQFKELINCRQPVMIRDFLKLKLEHLPSKLEKVEAASSIIKRFDTAAMSLGALSPEAHEALAIAMNRLGGRSNSGEGGEARHRYGQETRSKIKQVASARFGVTAEYLMSAEVIQIKIAQGAKPGEGGQLPGIKVNEMIATLRYCLPGVTLISPPPHHDIYSIEDLAQLIFDLKQINPKALISVKLVSAPGIGTIAAGVVKAYADMITISGYDGGTGASPLSSIRYTGCPWEFGLAETQRVLIENNLRHRVTLQVDGGFKTGLDVIKAALLGAESFGFGTAPMITLGCKYLRICHLNNCATGLATQDERLRKGYFHGQPERTMLYFQWVAEEVRELLAQLGFSRLQDVIGRVDLLSLLEQNNNTNNMGLDQLLDQPIASSEYRKKLYLHQPNVPFDKGILAKHILNDVLPAIEAHQSYVGQYIIANHNRSIGANIAGAIAQRYGDTGYKATIQLNFQGIAGQTFGAWLVQGMSFCLEGAANDYVCKGMSGGELIIKSFPNSQLIPKSTCLAGNTCLYGATGGMCFIDGMAGQRFAVRNSGATAVILAVGEHGCEYMTAGTVVVLSTPGNNFAAGMTGGIAFVYDDLDLLKINCNTESVTIHNMNDVGLISYQQQLIQLLNEFYSKTNSKTAYELLQNLDSLWSTFYLIVPQNINPHHDTKESP